MAEHTPGPWEVRTTPGSPEDPCQVGTGMVYTADACGPSLEERDANAHLIAAAPEMLEALERIAGKHYQSVGYAREQARAAIKKARGQ